LNYSVECLDLLKRMLERNKNCRPDADSCLMVNIKFPISTIL